MIKVYRYPGTDCITPEIIRRELADSGDGRDLIFVVPEFAKAQVEREIVGRLEDDCKARGAGIDSEGRNIPVLSSFTGGDVVSFITLSTRILDSMGLEASGSGSDIMMRCAIYSILANYSSDFKSFGKLTNRFEYINMLINLLGDFSRYGIRREELDEAIGASAPFLAEYRNKLEDLRLVMDAVDKMNAQFGLSLLKDRISEASQAVMALSGSELASRRMAGLRKLLSSRFVFIGFGAGRKLTPQEYTLVKLISGKGGDLRFYTLSTGNEQEAALPIYKVGNEFTSAMRSAGADVEDLAYRNEGGMCGLFEAFARGEDYKGDKTDKVRLAAIGGTDNQIGYVFSEVIKLTRDEGYRYRDIRIVCCDEDMASRLRSNAELYGLDIFIDRKIDLWSTVIPMFAETVLELPVHNYRISDILRAMRCGIIKLPPFVTDSFENYCRSRNITDGRRLFRESVYLKKDDDGGEHRQKIYFSMPYEGIREGSQIDAGEFFWNSIVVKKIIPLKDLAEKINSEKELSGKAKLLKELINSHREDVEALSKEQLDAGDGSSASALVRGYDEMMQLLTFFTHEMNDVPISQRAFISLIRTDMKNRVEGTIPLKVDSIEITTPDRAFVAPCKVMFLLGATRDNFPHRKSAEGLLSSGELRNLADSVKDCELPDKDEVKSREETVTCCLMLGTVTDRLYMVHNADKNFTSCVFDYLRACVEDDSIVRGFSNPAKGVFHKRNHDFRTASIAPEVMDRLLTTGDKKSLPGSVSAFEEYNNCAFKYMLDRILKIRERDDNTEIDTSGFGTLIHSMYEIGLSSIGGEDFRENADRLLNDDKAYEDAVNEAYRSAVIKESIPGSLEEDGETIAGEFDMNIGMKLKRMYKLTFRGILEDLNSEGLIPTGFEVPIGDNEDVSIDSSRIEEKTGLHLAFSGYVDRVDTDEEAKRIRIIDYKSGGKNINPKQLFYGTQIQLPVYTKALSDRYEIPPENCDYGYFNVGLKPAKNKGAAEFAPKMSGYKQEEMAATLEYSQQVLTKTAESIKSGRADALVCPAHNYCSFCPYGGACGNIPSSPIAAVPPLGYDAKKADYKDAIRAAAEGDTGEDNE